MSQDVFQLRMDAILEQCPGVIGIHDDMVIFGVDQEDHDANLTNVCQKEGLVLNSKKLELRRERVTFFRAEYSAQGMCNVVCFRPSAMKKSQMQYFNIKIVYSVGFCSRIGN